MVFSVVLYTGRIRHPSHRKSRRIENMKILLNTLYVTLEDAYATLDGENIVIKQKDTTVARFPLHILEAVYLYSYAGASPSLMGKCADMGIDLVFCSPAGRFLARTTGMSRGNVLLRRKQYRAADSREESCQIARNFIFGKVKNSRKVIDRAIRDHSLKLDTEKLSKVSDYLKDQLNVILETNDLDALRGIEGVCASQYFSVFDDLILCSKETFYFHGRNRRPPLDNVNALLSYAYTMLASSCASALETVGLDSYVGFMHRDRPGRTSMAQDLMEELRPCIADRFVLTLINNRIIDENDFQHHEDGAVLLTDDGRKKMQKEWQAKKKEKVTHPFLKEKLEWGLIPYIQAMLLARYLRSDLDGYPPFLWR